MNFMTADGRDSNDRGEDLVDWTVMKYAVS
jgi:hypothetical protein